MKRSELPLYKDLEKTEKEILKRIARQYGWRQSDYIECPKESGYRSLHLVMEIPVYLSKTEHHVRVEIQLRTIAMDFWASLEHQLHYKNDAEVPDSIRRELFRVAETIAMTDREMEEIAIELQALD